MQRYIDHMHRHGHGVVCAPQEEGQAGMMRDRLNSVKKIK